MNQICHKLGTFWLGTFDSGTFWLGTLWLWDVLTRDVLTLGRFDLGRYDFGTLWLGTFWLGTLWLWDVLTWDVLTLGRFDLGTFWLWDILTLGRFDIGTFWPVTAKFMWFTAFFLMHRYISSMTMHKLHVLHCIPSDVLNYQIDDNVTASSYSLHSSPNTIAHLQYLHLSINSPHYEFQWFSMFLSISTKVWR